MADHRDPAGPNEVGGPPDLAGARHPEHPRRPHGPQASAGPRYLLGAGADAFLLGPGATIVVTGVLLALSQLGGRAAALSSTLALWLAWMFVGPHYAATYRRAYSSLEVVRAHPLVTLVAPPLLLALTMIALRHPYTFGILYFAAYVGWAGYHYSGQSLGLAMLYPLRQGQRLDALEKRLIAVPLYLSWILSLLGLLRLQGRARNPAYDLVRAAYPGWPLPAWVPAVGLAVLAVSLACVGVVAWRRARRGTPLPWPTYAVLSAQLLWFSIGLYNPFLNIRLVPVFHSLQYLAFTTWHSCHQPAVLGWRRLLWYVVPTALLGLAIYPGSFTFLNRGLGYREMMVMSAAVATFFNLHHFLLDGRVWRMRERPLAATLVT